MATGHRQTDIATRRCITAVAIACLLSALWPATGIATGRGATRGGVRCPFGGPVPTQKTGWSATKYSMAPRGAKRISLCRYRRKSQTGHFKLAGSGSVTHQRTKHELISLFDDLRQYRGRPVTCKPVGTQVDVTATLVYPDGHRVTIVALLYGCGSASNGDLRRPMYNVNRTNPAGPRLAAQLIRLTRHRTAYPR